MQVAVIVALFALGYSLLIVAMLVIPAIAGAIAGWVIERIPSP